MKREFFQVFGVAQRTEAVVELKRRARSSRTRTALRCSWRRTELSSGLQSSSRFKLSVRLLRRTQKTAAGRDGGAGAAFDVLHAAVALQVGVQRFLPYRPHAEIAASC